MMNKHSKSEANLHGQELKSRQEIRYMIKTPPNSYQIRFIKNFNYKEFHGNLKTTQ